MEGSEMILTHEGAWWHFGDMKEAEGRKSEPMKEGRQKNVRFRETTLVISTKGKGAHLLDILDLTLQLVNILLMDHLISRPPLQVHLK